LPLSSFRPSPQLTSLFVLALPSLPLLLTPFALPQLLLLLLPTL
jgi:hypothetical protein